MSRLDDAITAVVRAYDAGRSMTPEKAADLRRLVAEGDPLRFALMYLRRHLVSGDGTLSLSTVHEEWIDYALTWNGEAEPGVERDAFVAPREMGKSTWVFLLLPLWAAATGRVRFAAAFADSAPQAEGHLATFKRELDENRMLRADYPELCAPAKRSRGAVVSDNRGMLHTASGFVFAARGIDSGTLGMKVGERRPDLIILDDVEPGEANYSAYQAEKRRGTISDVVLPLNVRARVCLAGTVTMPGSIVHTLVQYHEGSLEAGVTWPADDGWRVHHAGPWRTDENGERVSVWPEKWPTEYLRSIEHTRSFAKNFLNSPIATDGAYWTPEVYRYGDVPAAGRVLLSVDPAVTKKKSADYTGLSVVAYVPPPPGGKPGAVVRHAEEVKVGGQALRRRALAMVEEYEVTHLLVETNQGGDLWEESVFHDFPVPVITKHNTEPKEVRAARALGFYEAGRVLHAATLPALEAQQCAFPRAPHDDMVDSVANAVNRLLTPRPTKRAARATTIAYAG